MPTQNQVHVDRPLTDVSLAFMQDTDAFISSDVFPTNPVQHQSDQYYTYPLEAFTSTNAQIVGDKDVAPETDYDVNTDTYYANVHGVRNIIGDQERSNADSQFNLEQEATQQVMRDLLIEKEIDWNSTFFTTGTWDTDVDVISTHNAWNTASGTPIVDITEEIETVEANTGFRPNTLVASGPVIRAITNNDNFIDRVKYTQQASQRALRDALANALDIDRVLRATAVENTANAGASASIDYVTNDNALLTYVPDSPGLRTPAAGYTMAWSSALDGQAAENGMGIRSYRLDEKRGDAIEGLWAYDHKLVSSALGVLFHNILS